MNSEEIYDEPPVYLGVVESQEHLEGTRLDKLVIGFRGGSDKATVVHEHGVFEAGNVVIFFGENCLLPSWMVEATGLKFSGPDKNRVKARKFFLVRPGLVSEGIVLFPKEALNKAVVSSKEYNSLVAAADNNTLASHLNVSLYRPPVPKASLQGEVFNVGHPLLTYKIERANPDNMARLFSYDEPAYVTEKLNGTWCCLGWDGEQVIVTSKGLSAQGLAFNAKTLESNNVYAEMWRRHEKDIRSAIEGFPEGVTFYLLGEIVGQGIQGNPYKLQDRRFYGFDVYYEDGYLAPCSAYRVFDCLNMRTVPFLGAFVYRRYMELSFDALMAIPRSWLNPEVKREGVIVRTPLDHRLVKLIGV